MVKPVSSSVFDAGLNCKTLQFGLNYRLSRLIAFKVTVEYIMNLTPDLGSSPSARGQDEFSELAYAF